MFFDLGQNFYMINPLAFSGLCYDGSLNRGFSGCHRRNFQDRRNLPALSRRFKALGVASLGLGVAFERERLNFVLPCKAAKVLVADLMTSTLNQAAKRT